MSAADYAMRQAMSSVLDRPQSTTRKYYARDEFSLRNFWPREGSTLPDRLSIPMLDSPANLIEIDLLRGWVVAGAQDN